MKVKLSGASADLTLASGVASRTSGALRWDGPCRLGSCRCKVVRRHFFGGSAAFVPHSGAWDRRSAVKMEPKSLSLAQDSPEPKERVQQQQQQRQRPGRPKSGDRSSSRKQCCGDFGWHVSPSADHKPNCMQAPTTRPNCDCLGCIGIARLRVPFFAARSCDGAVRSFGRGNRSVLVGRQKWGRSAGANVSEARWDGNELRAGREARSGRSVEESVLSSVVRSSTANAAEQCWHGKSAQEVE